MYFRHDRYLLTETMTRDKTYSKPLPNGGILDSAIATVRIKNKSDQYLAPEPLILDHITKIEIKGDGQRPFKSYWGQTCLAEYAYAMGTPAPAVNDVMSANYQTQTFPILFGKKLFDGTYGLDLSKEAQVMLHMTNDFATSELDTAYNIELDLDLWFIEDPATSINKYLQTFEHETWTWTGASQKHKYLVPKEDTVRRMFIYAKDPRTAVDSAQTNKAFRSIRYLKYTRLSGKERVRDDDLYRHDQDCLWGYPDIIETEGLLEARTDAYFDTFLCRPTQLVVCPAYSADPGGTSDLVIDQRVERFLKFRRATQASNQARFTARGTGYLDHLLIREDLIDDEAHYLNPASKANVEIEIGNSSSGGSSGTTGLVIQTPQSQ